MPRGCPNSQVRIGEHLIEGVGLAPLGCASQASPAGAHVVQTTSRDTQEGLSVLCPEVKRSSRRGPTEVFGKRWEEQKRDRVARKNHMEKRWSPWRQKQTSKNGQNYQALLPQNLKGHLVGR